MPLDFILFSSTVLMTWKGAGIQLCGDTHCRNQTGASYYASNEDAWSTIPIHLLLPHKSLIISSSPKSLNKVGIHMRRVYLALIWATRTPRVVVMFTEAISGTPPIHPVTCFTVVCRFVPPVGSVFLWREKEQDWDSIRVWSSSPACGLF